MITWMQKHKKWLISTIWVSTIAFVGAGFVGWGSYNYGKSNDTIAIVGDKEVPLRDLQNQYNTLYAQYQQLFGGNLTKETAKQLGLEKVAFNSVIQKYLLLNYADSLGIIATNKDVAKKLVQIKAFQKNGKFDKNTYLSVLKQNRQTTAMFEKQLKDDIVIAKIQKIFASDLLPSEIKNLSKLLFSEDKVSIAILDINNIKIKISNEEIKQYWQKNKEKYKTNKGFKIAYVDIENIKSKNKQEMKKVALREYLKLKKNKSNFTKEIVLYENSDFLPPQELSKIFVATQNKVLKPIYNKDHYIVVKLISTIKPKALPYQEAKQMAKDDLIASKKEQIINQKINNMIQNFTGTDIGYISKYKTPTIKGLTKDEVSNVVKSIFNSQKSIDKIKFNDKVVVYKITDSRFVKYNKDKDGIILETMSDLKSNLVFANLLKQLQTRYAIQSFMESK